MKKKLLLPLLFIALRATAQSPSLPPAPLPDYTKMAIQTSQSWIDVDYIGDHLTGHLLDIHLPTTGKAPFPIVICVYGSAWFSNNSKEATFHDGLGQRLLKAGFAVVSINHRSSRDAVFPAQIQDVKAAIRFIRANSNKFSLDSRFIGITGWSSGGHLSALTGTTNTTKQTTIGNLPIDIEGNLGQFTAASSQVNAVVDWYGPTDFLLMDGCGSALKHDDSKSPESTLIGGPIQENKDKVALANPVSYVSKSNPPFLIIHGDKDLTVPRCESVRLYEALQQAGVRSEFITVSGGGHGPGVQIDTYYDKMIAFFQNELKMAGK